MISYSLADFKPIVPELVLLFFTFLILFVDFAIPKAKKKINGFIALIGVVITFVVVLSLYGSSWTGFNDMIVFDKASGFVNVVLLLTAFVAILMSLDFIKREEINFGEYYEILLFSLVAMQVFGSTYNLIVMFLAVETLSIAMYILTAIKRNGLRSTEAAMKYFILGSFASSFLILGIALIYGLFGTVDLLRTKELLTGADTLHTWIAIVSFVLILVGFGFKIAAFPFHAWTPDVYEGAITPISAFMSIAPKAASFMALMRLLVVGMFPIQVEWTKLLWVIAVFTMFFGNLVALWQKDLKRLLGYSSIAHAGYMLVGITAANSLGYGAVLFYLFGYIFMNLGAFSVAEYISKKDVEGCLIDDLRGMGYKYPLTGAAMLIFMFSLAGVPPTVGFVGKYYLFSAAVKSHLYWLAVLGVINSAISAYFYLNIIVTMYMKGGAKEEVVSFPSPYLRAAIAIGAVGTILFGVAPGSVLNAALSSIVF
ncbi:MAG: NADH-quinone oxidoreductase subunit N [Deltaproteobacteria bacterium]|nr:NADH-quinone oxidoreductase subunit N [Deltaproteobacteria bacterium]